MLAFSASFSGPASAQQTAEPAPELPPLVVETTGKKKKTTPAKKAAASPVPQAPPAVQPAAERADTPPLPGQAGPAVPGAYKADYVSSNKITGPLLNTPQTVTVVPGTIIQERKTTTLIETLRQTPGITIDAGENAFGSGGNAFNIRGFNSTGNVFIDGTRDNGSYVKDTYNTEQVEIIKGAAADNGRGGAGGYVNIVTKTPKLENFVESNVGIGFDEYDSEMRRRAALDVNQAYGTTAVRLNSFIQDGGVAGRDIAEANAWGVAPSLAFGLGTDTRAIFQYEHVERRDVPDSGVSFNRGGDGIWIGGAGVNTNGSGTGSRDTYFGRRTDFDDVNADAFTARFEYDIAPGVTITNQTRWAEINREADYHFASAPTIGAAGHGFYDRTNESLYNQTNLSARFTTGSWRHTLSTGVEFSREKADAFRFDSTPPISHESSNVKIDTAAAYLYDTIELSKKWQVVGGLRVEHYDVELEGDNLAGGPAYSDSDVTVGGKVGVIYKPVKEGSLYASYGISHLPHGSLLSNPDTSRTGENAFPGFVPGADPVELHNYEVGVKWDWLGGKFSTTAALFRTEKHNVAITGRDVGQPAPATFKGYGEQTVEGIEIGFAGDLTDRWKAFGGLTLLESERNHSAYLDDVRRRANAADYGTSLSTNGDQLAFTPKVYATLWTTYDFTDKLTLGAGFQYVGESFIGRPDDATRIIKNGVYGKLPDYFLVNLMASYDITDNIELSLNVDNVFDELYLTTANWNGAWGYLGAPRTYWLSANVKF
jgi:catecholate siderophore receptor